MLENPERLLIAAGIALQCARRCFTFLPEFRGQDQRHRAGKVYYPVINQLKDK
jgi:hypothetical protein